MSSRLWEDLDWSRTTVGTFLRSRVRAYPKSMMRMMGMTGIIMMMRLIMMRMIRMETIRLVKID